jgi:hypothetical protein
MRPLVCKLVSRVLEEKSVPPFKKYTQACPSQGPENDKENFHIELESTDLMWNNDV